MSRGGRVPVITPRRAAAAYRRSFQDTRRERLFLSSVSFFTTFAAARVVTHAIRAGRGPFHNLSAGGRHLHHLVFGIAGLLGSGYLWMIVDEHPTGDTDDAIAKFNSVLYGGASALTLDEFALWLDLQDVYWTRQGRQSIDAVLLFGGLLSIGLWGGPFFRELFRELRHI
ncbi:MAG: hypothetical protein QOE18_35 [Chloroflexota bacterium]|jgi:hypothetical protein|nr:hypothetical protein [Chloroflexota bacterium]